MLRRSINSNTCRKCEPHFENYYCSGIYEKVLFTSRISEHLSVQRTWNFRKKTCLPCNYFCFLLDTVNTVIVDVVKDLKGSPVGCLEQYH